MNDSIETQYNKSKIYSASPEETVLMLYDGAIRFLRSAVAEIVERENIPKKAELIDRALKIIDYLHSCLDKEKGGGIAENLNLLYDYMMIQLTEANMRNDHQKIEEVVNLLITLREGWNKIISDNKRDQEAEVNREWKDVDAGFHSEYAKAPKKIAVKV